MAGRRYLFITKDGEVNKMSYPKEFIFKIPTEISNENVLSVTLLYETLDKKPFKLSHVEFERLQLNGTVLDYKALIETRSYLISQRPVLKYVPTENEIEVLVNYIKNNMEVVYGNGLEVIGAVMKETREHNLRR